ncbi:serine hydrolase domain-containing protein [Streptomyces botrytidirepellens]|uniref:Class C beta-lactamase-related serine hydrolase n=1 Tax=Streptomyces botrytidirepellens TaxID=2486417 RepID=A0A3M8TMH7_9ACTN|nr:serine hydrolase [Streptomyces botrytidirepellens]RNF93296.1 class C beta-lactamase-related serine hydrolase [Streptomyces botrytidirepellens]
MDEAGGFGDPWEGVDAGGVAEAARRQGERSVPGVGDMAAYLDAQVADASHREVIGPLLDGGGASGVVVRRGAVIASWGDPARVEMAYSATKSVLALVAGVAHDDGLLELDEPVRARVGLPQFDGAQGRAVTWRHLLDQTSQWEGELWGKPTSVDAQSTREGTESAGGPPGAGWAYNDVRVNLTALALTVLFRRALPDVLRERVMAPIGASSSWSWHGYADAFVDLDGSRVPVVSGGAHWGGGLWINALDLARLGQLCLRGGRWGHTRVVSARWIEHMWTPCRVKPNYGLSWWLNDHRTVWPTAPATGRCARGNGGGHLLWVDPARDLVISSRWGAHVESLLAAVSEAVQPAPVSASA